MEHYGAEDSALTTKDYAMNITVKEALRSRGAEAERDTQRAVSNDKQEGVDTCIHVRTFEIGLHFRLYTRFSIVVYDRHCRMTNSKQISY